MVRRLDPAARLPGYSHVGDPVGDGGADPDVIETAPAVGRLPVGRPVAPPCIEFGRLRHEGPQNVVPCAGRLYGGEFFAFDRRMRNELQQLRMTPHIVFQRRDIEVADHDGAVPAPGLHVRGCAHFVQEGELVGEFSLIAGSGSSPPAGT